MPCKGTARAKTKETVCVTYIKRFAHCLEDVMRYCFLLHETFMMCFGTEKDKQESHYTDMLQSRALIPKKKHHFTPNFIIRNKCTQREGRNLNYSAMYDHGHMLFRFV
ncbi:hypothetical protein NPIL_562731 [Nephila pilipes]|uniref:Uncharacterized protein n=1 Tax=Nephila pilipes TaxID=299642 RepID=A0A8X6QLW8_NEPPI|nr:hypothetical protein NPIL_562731 [Nephila pilipes]